MRERLMGWFLNIMEQFNLIDLILISLVFQMILLSKAPYILLLMWIINFTWVITSGIAVEHCEN